MERFTHRLTFTVDVHAADDDAAQRWAQQAYGPLSQQVDDLGSEGVHDAVLLPVADIGPHPFLTSAED